MSLTINDCWSAEEHEKILHFSSENLWRFIQSHGSIYEKDVTIQNLIGLNSNQVRKLANIHLLLAKETQDFIEKIAPYILRKLSKSTNRQEEIVRGKVNGQVKWPKTVLKQQTEKNPSVFVCINRSSIFDLIENKMLLYCINYLFKVGQSLLNKGLELGEPVSADHINDKWINKIKYIVYKCKILLKDPFIRNISEIHTINQHHIQKTKRARGQYYYYLAQIAELIFLQKNKPIDFLYHVFSKQLLQPLSKDTLFEIAVVFRILAVFKKSNWIERDISLIGEGQKVLSVLQKGDWKINLYYQQLPSHFVEQSLYKELMRESHLSIHHRRPDIMLEWINKDGNKNYTIVEVKRSQNRGYLADGLYKVLGYLKDFEIPMQSSIHSAGLLVGWKIKDLNHPKEGKEVYTADWSSLQLYIDQLEKNILETDELV
ncbi:hypothetical protein Q0N30_12425 [Priestia megaterium]|uniref:hypothetical protein n=1 Tax=Priestia megaterium TaxID=1404 RepID=UPI003458B92D